jgi:hypothetical protein
MSNYRRSNGGPSASLSLRVRRRMSAPWRRSMTGHAGIRSHADFAAARLITGRLFLPKSFDAGCLLSE